MSRWKLPPAAAAGTLLVGTLLVGAGGTRWWRRRQATRAALGQWAVVTVLRPRTEVTGSEPYRRLRDQGVEVEVELREAPGNRGTEVAARRRPGSRGGASRADLRTSLRELKQRLETGEVLQATPRPQGLRPPTPGGLVIDLADRRAQGEGAL
jgi:hypothetical protein